MSPDQKRNNYAKNKFTIVDNPYKEHNFVVHEGQTNRKAPTKGVVAGIPVTGATKSDNLTCDKTPQNKKIFNKFVTETLKESLKAPQNKHTIREGILYKTENNNVAAMLVDTVQVDQPCDAVPKEGVLIHMFKHHPDERGNLQYMTTLPMTK